eukprot:s338_g13.t1
MADLSAELCIRVHGQGKAFSLEHPGNSIALHLDSWKRLRQLKGVFTIFYHTCRFNGSRRKKFQVLITNRKHFLRLLDRQCHGALCERTGEKHLRWRPTTAGGRVVQFQTGDEREYPVGFCEAYASCAADFLSQSGKFVEVFSGPNAPLSSAIGREMHAAVPGGILDTKKGVKNELQSVAQLMKDSCDPLHTLAQAKGSGAEQPSSRAKKQTLECHGELKPGEGYNRLVVTQAARQPGYGKRVQLIPDGENDPIRHLEKAIQLEHPFSNESVLKEEHRSVLARVGKVSSLEIKRKLQTLGEWKRLANSRSTQEEQLKHEELAGECAKRLGRKPRTALMEQLGRRYKVEDLHVPRLCLSGMPIVGTALESPFFLPYHVPASITIHELLKSAPMRRQKTMGRVKLMGLQGGEELSSAIWDKTLREVQKGTMAGPYSQEEIRARHGPFYNVVPSFGLKQGFNEQGEPKFRRIDDHSASHNNLAAERTQKIQMAMVDYLMVMISAAAKVYPKLVIATEDMAGAYRQVPLCDSQVGISITAVFNPVTKQPSLFEIFGQPFGAAHAVPNFYRLAEFAQRLLTRGFNILLDHFFDDFFAVMNPDEAATVMFCVREAFLLLGLTLDAEKSQPPAEVAQVLGVAFNTKSLQTQKVLLVEPKPTRVQNLCFLIDQVLETNSLGPNLAASILGKFGFLCSTMFGKVGRCCTGALRARQYQQHSELTLTPEIITSLNLMKIFAKTAPVRQLKVDDSRGPILLYTDASDVPEREPRWLLGAVLIDPTDGLSIEYTYYSVTEEIVNGWNPKQNYMGQLEILACPLAVATWETKLAGRRVIMFVDNDSAASGLVKGYSPKSDSTALIGHFWLLVAAVAAEVYLDRVESKSNLADGPSRLEFQLMHLLHATYVSPQVDCHNLDPLGAYTDGRIWDALRCAHLDSLVRLFTGELDYQVTDEGSNLSFGQRQLFCLARMVLRQPALLLLDEATSAIDPRTQDRHAFPDSTLVAIAHRLETVLDFDQLVVLDAGEVAEKGTVKELQTRQDWRRRVHFVGGRVGDCLRDRLTMGSLDECSQPRRYGHDAMRPWI